MNRDILDETLSTMFSSITYKKTYLFYAHMIGKCSIKIDENLPAPAGVAFITNHYNLYINPLQFDNYSLEERLAILKHEVLHILENHIGRQEDRKHRDWNYATDCAINQLIEKEHLPKNCILPHTFPVKNCKLKESAEYYYDMLEKNEKSFSESSEQFDTHETWELSTGDEDLKIDLTKNMIEKSLQQTIRDKGDIPKKINDYLDLFTRKSELNWKKILRGIIGNKKVSKRPTIMRKDRRFPNRPDLKGKTKDRLFNLLVIADVSGSVDDNSLLTLLSEIQHICDITKSDLDLIQIDTIASEPEKISKKTKILTRKSKGGTLLFNAIEKAEECKIDFDAVVITTDGFLFKEDIVKFKNLNKKIIWLINKKGRIMEEMSSNMMKSFKLEK